MPTLIHCSLSTDDVQLLQPIVHTTQTHVYAGWWFQSPWKICSSKWVHLPQIGVKLKEYLKPPPSTGCTFVFEQDPSNCHHGYVCCCCTPTTPWCWHNSYSTTNKTLVAMAHSYLLIFPGWPFGHRGGCGRMDQFWGVNSKYTIWYLIPDDDPRKKSTNVTWKGTISKGNDRFPSKVCRVWCFSEPMKTPCEWYIYLYIYHTNQPFM